MLLKLLCLVIRRRRNKSPATLTSSPSTMQRYKIICRDNEIIEIKKAPFSRRMLFYLKLSETLLTKIVFYIAGSFLLTKRTFKEKLIKTHLSRFISSCKGNNNIPQMYCLTRLFCKTTKFSPAMVQKEQIPIDKEDGR